MNDNTAAKSLTHPVTAVFIKKLKQGKPTMLQGSICTAISVLIGKYTITFIVQVIKQSISQTVNLTGKQRDQDQLKQWNMK